MKRRLPQAIGFYPGDLREQVRSFLQGFEIPAAVPPELRGAIVPHAGWAYSGGTAARTIHTLCERARPRTIVLLGSVHVPGVDRPTIYPEGIWETPVGPIEIDTDVVQRLASRLGPAVRLASEAHDGDHALEVQMPFIRILAPGCRVVPIAFPPTDDAAGVGTAIGEELREDADVLVVASSDLTHYGEPYGLEPAGSGDAGQRWMEANDRRMLEKIEAVDGTEIVKEARGHHNACGPGAVAATLASARARGSKRGVVLEYTTSFRIRPEPTFRMAVGYVGAVC